MANWVAATAHNPVCCGWDQWQHTQFRCSEVRWGYQGQMRWDEISDVNAYYVQFLLRFVFYRVHNKNYALRKIYYLHSCNKFCH